jgi:hypothetical protein
MRPILLLVTGAVFVALGASLSLAQTAAEPDGPATTDDCVAPPLDDPLAPETATADSLTDTLAPCDGVLAPPPVGDQEMTVTPPALGETPIIPPELVPPQSPQD